MTIIHDSPRGQFSDEVKKGEPTGYVLSHRGTGFFVETCDQRFQNGLMSCPGSLHPARPLEGIPTIYPEAPPDIPDMRSQILVPACRVDHLMKLTISIVVT
jgi:hypothetical protein